MRVVAFGAHPDDIETGMGGTIARFSKEGHEVLIVITTIPDDFEVRKKESIAAAKAMGAKITFLDIDPYKLKFGRELVEKYDKILKEFNPDEIYCPWNHDSHQDHRAVAESVIATTRKNNASVFMFEQTIPGGITPYGFRAQKYIDISDTFDKKIKSLDAHKSQIDRNNIKWLTYGLKGRAMFRGYQVGVNYAEAFEVVKEVSIIKK